MLKQLQERHRLIGDVRCPGLFCAIELVRDRETKEPAREETGRLYSLGMERGVVFGTSRYAGLGNVVKFKPPLTISRDEIDRALEVLDDVLTQIERPDQTKRPIEDEDEDVLDPMNRLHPPRGAPARARRGHPDARRLGHR